MRDKPVNILHEVPKNTDHDASVIVDITGKLHVKEQTINIANGFKKDKLISVVPDSEERLIKFDDAEAVPYFKDLALMNLILTNACNLSCSYCYEQHRKDFGRFTVESLKKAYDWLVNINDAPKKYFQFFGGEPLIHKKLILDFLKTYKTELASNCGPWPGEYFGTYVSIVSNGILLDDEFIEEYFDNHFSHMLISLDTFDAENDYREIKPEQMDKILYNIKKSLDVLGDNPQRLIIRVTLAEENADTLQGYIEQLYAIGVRSLIVHPLTLDASRGELNWTRKNWDTMHTSLVNVIYKYTDLKITFSEGVGTIGENNCMIGSDMIAIDASGDYSGCYFFTNRKAEETASGTILGNVFNGELYIDRYKKFLQIYRNMFSHPQCQSCDLQNSCYQCPAGNIGSGGKELFRPDGHCQDIVKLYLALKEDIEKKDSLEMVARHHINLKREGYSYIENILEDLGYNKSVSPKEHYMNACKERGIPENYIDIESEYVDCFYVHLLAIIR